MSKNRELKCQICSGGRKGAVCWKCQGELQDWERCAIDGARNGIVQLPTWTVFRIEARGAVFLRTHNASSWQICKLAGMAAEAFRLLRPMRIPRPCRHPHL
jgi:hypothetical protein